MEPHIKSHIASYLNDSFIFSLERFEHLVHNSNENISHCSKTNVYTDSNTLLNLKSVSSLLPGVNKLVSVELTVVRVLWNEFYTFLLTTEKLTISKPQEMYCVIIETASFQAPYFEGWKKQLGPMAVILFKQPYLEIDNKSDLSIIRVMIENSEIKQHSKWKCDISQIKKIGNQFYNKGDYLNALYYYEYCLGCCHNYFDSNTRAILYGNSAASLCKLNLYDISITYSNIASRIDREYYKAYVWKVHCLLEKKLFGEIPNLLVILQSKTNPNDFLKINSKYSIYLSNSLGIYNWKLITQEAKKKQITIGEYYNKNIGFKSESQRIYFTAIDNIKKQTTIIISKPLIYDRKGEQNKALLFDRLSKNYILQKSFAKAILDISNSIDRENKDIDFIFAQKQGQKKMSKFFKKPKDITCDDSQVLGIWQQVFKFAHNCNPNCSIVHFDNIMVVSAIKNISKGEVLTIDIAASQPPAKRKQFLLREQGIYCKCGICEWKSMSEFANNEQVSKVADTAMNKQIFWELMNKKAEIYPQELINKLSKLVIKEINWQDMIFAMKLIRESEEKALSNLLQIAVAGFQAFFKIPAELALEIVNNLK